jgi:hypothetical protein
MKNYDIVFDKIGSEKTDLQWQKKSDGTYRVYMTIGTVDQKLQYYNPETDSFHYEHQTKGNLFHPDSLASAVGMAVTVGHPQTRTFDQNDENILVGSTLSEIVKENDSKLSIASSILDKRAIAIIDDILSEGSGLQAEISPGYRRYLEDYDKTLNSWVQSPRIYDHVAILKIGEGRAGQESTVRTDEKDCKDRIIFTFKGVEPKIDNKSSTFMEIEENIISTYEYDDGTIEKTETNIRKIYETMTTYTIGNNTIDCKEIEIEGKKYHLTEDVKNIVNKSQKLVDNQSAEVAKLTGQIEVLQSSVNDSQNKYSVEQFSQMMADSMQLWEKVLPVFRADNKSFQPDYSLTPEEIKILFIKNQLPTNKIDSYSGDQLTGYVDGVWAALSTSVKPKDSNDKIRQQLDSLQSSTSSSSEITNDFEDRMNESQQKVKDRISKNGLVK